MVRIAPSLLAADFGNLAEQVGEVAEEADWLHVDVMDGHFVPNITIGPPVVASLRRHTGMFLDCHLMIAEPVRYIEAFAEAGADSATVHVEVPGATEAIGEARRLGLRTGIALNPDTPFDEDALALLDGSGVDLVLVMTVFPGFGGQTFMHEVLPKIEAARAAIDAAGLDAALEVDGGIDLETAPLCAQRGADVFVAGTAIFGEPEPWKAVRALREAVTDAARRHGATARSASGRAG